MLRGTGQLDARAYPQWHLDIDVPASTMRICWDIAETIPDAEIERALTEAFRAERRPNLVLTLCGGTIVGEVALCADDDLEGDLFDLEDALGKAHNDTITLTRAPKDANGYGVVIAYVMPPRYHQDYKAGDEYLIDRFGTEAARYQQRRSG